MIGIAPTAAGPDAVWIKPSYGMPVQRFGQ